MREMRVAGSLIKTLEGVTHDFMFSTPFSSLYATVAHLCMGGIMRWQGAEAFDTHIIRVLVLGGENENKS